MTDVEKNAARPVVSLEHARKSFGEAEVLRDISLSVSPGECRYRARIYAKWADSSLKIGTSLPPVSLSTETNVPFPNVLRPSVTIRSVFCIKHPSPMR